MTNVRKHVDMYLAASIWLQKNPLPELNNVEFL